MLSKLDKFQLFLKMDADYMPAEYESDLFHYTSPAGFSSILFGDLEQVTLWASRNDCLNDASEGTVVEEVYQEVRPITLPLFLPLLQGIICHDMPAYATICHHMLSYAKKRKEI